MNRLDHTFGRARQEKRAAFVAYITCGDPTLDRTKQLVREFATSGVDVLELGVPFSDPMADGIPNQEAANRALKHGVTMGDVLRTARELREESIETPIVLFTYYNPVFAYGLDRFAPDAAASGVDGVLLVDVPPEESGECVAGLRENGISTIFLVAPTTDEQRLPEIIRETSGFVYYVSQTGVTGERSELAGGVQNHVEAVRSMTELPIAVGFGISTPDHVREVAGYADGVIVGSAIVRRIGEGGDTDEMVSGVADFVRSLTAPLHVA